MVQHKVQHNNKNNKNNKNLITVCVSNYNDCDCQTIDITGSKIYGFRYVHSNVIPDHDEYNPLILSYDESMKPSHEFNLPTLCNKQLILESFIRLMNIEDDVIDFDLYYVSEGYNGIGDWTYVTHIKNNDNFVTDYRIELNKNNNKDKDYEVWCSRYQYVIVRKSITLSLFHQLFLYLLPLAISNIIYQYFGPEAVLPRCYYRTFEPDHGYCSDEYDSEINNEHDHEDLFDHDYYCSDNECEELFSGNTITGCL